MKKERIFVIILSILFIGITTLVLTNNITSFDDIIYNFLFQFRCDGLDFFFKTITKFGNMVTILCFMIVLLLKFKNDDRNMLGVSTIIIVLSNLSLKNIIRRARPSHLRLIKQGGFSFPSGHAMISIAVYGYLVYYVYKNVKNKKLKILLMMLLLLLIIGIGLSRIYVGVHYPSDILAGYILSLIIEISTISFYMEKGGKIK